MSRINLKWVLTATLCRISLFGCVYTVHASSAISGAVSPQTFLQESYRQIYKEKFVFGDPYLNRIENRTKDIKKTLPAHAGAQLALSHVLSYIDHQKGNLTGEVFLPDQSKRLTKAEFYGIYGPYITSSKEFPERCFEGYEELDTLARQKDFPTVLIIAARYKESGCNLQNPRNGDGLFQIVAHDYGTGEISIAWLLEQAEHFIDFSNAKRERYKKLQRFDDVPVQITYDGRTLQDIRKQAVLYNGMAAGVTLENSWYANNGFAWYARPDISSQDWLVTMLLKAIAQEYAYNDKHMIARD